MLRIVKDCALKISRSLGYDIVPLRDVKERDFAIHLRQLFNRLDVDCVFDVGANVGQYHDFLRRKVFYEGPIVSFEPIARNIATLKERSEQDPHWWIEGYALGRNNKTMPINVMISDQFSSFLEPNNANVPEFAGLNDTSYTELVEVKTLDTIFPMLQETLGFERPYLKLDTQGFDIEVLNGTQAVLPLIHGLQTEASIIGIYRTMPNYIETIRFLNGCGFEITGLYPISRDDTLRLIEFDCVMINSALAQSASRRVGASA